MLYCFVVLLELHRHAQFLVAIYYALGYHTKKDWDLAKQYLCKSAEQDFSRAQADLGIMLVKDQMYVEGLQWLERAEQAVNTYIDKDASAEKADIHLLYQ